VRVGAAAQADNGYLRPLGNHSADLVRHQLQEDRHRARFLQRPRIVHDLLGLLRALALQPEAAERGDALRRQPQMAHDRDARGDDCTHAGADFRAALQLDAVARRLCHEAARVKHRGLVRGLIAHVGHVADQPAVGRAATHGLCVADHVVHRDGQGRLVAQHGHAQAVAHEDDVNAGLFDQRRHRVVVAGNHGEGCALGHLVEEYGQGDLLTLLGHGVTPLSE